MVNAPVIGVAEDALDIREEAVDFCGDRIKGIRQLFIQYAVCQILSLLKIFNIRKRIMVHGVGEAFGLEKSGEIFTAIEIDLGIIREPGLEFEEHPAELGIIIIKIIMLAFRHTGSHFQLLGISVGLYRDDLARLDSRECADETFLVGILQKNLPGEGTFISLSRRKIGKGAAILLDIGVNMGTQGKSLLPGKRIKILKKDIFLDQIV